jgi:hypothetical protein
MRFLSVAERELRAGARQKSTHRLRWITAGVFFALLAWLMWVFDGFRAPQIFNVFCAITFFYCLLVGTARTADCLSSEKREGTMGLLFLTNLNGPEIIGGKLCSSAVAAAYGLFAIFPLLALQMLIGGITLAHFWRTILALANVILFAIASGFLASSICLRQFTAIAWATGVALFFTVGLMAEAAILSSWGGTTVGRNWIEGMVIFSPLYTLISADGNRGMFGPNHYWWSVLAVIGVATVFLGIATWRISYSWRDRGTGRGRWSKLALLERWRERGRAGRAGFRRKVLGINPFYWLGCRGRVSAPGFMLLTIVLVATTSFVAAPFFARVLRGGIFTAMLGHLMAWLWAGISFHVLVLYFAAMAASRRLAEDKEAGALELVLSTPTSEASIGHGLWMAYARRMFFPGTVAILVHFFFLWQGATMFVLDAPGTKLPPGTTVTSLMWHVLFNLPLAGNRVEWQFVMAMRIVLLLLAGFIAIWITLGYVGRWLGLRMKHPGLAPMVCLGIIIVPPIILFTMACYCADKAHVMNLPERIVMPLLMWVAAAIGAMHCVLLSIWAAGRLRAEFRNVVTSRFQPKPVGSWWKRRRRGLLRLALGAAVGAAALFTIVLSFYGYQNWRSRREWSGFQRELKQRKVSLEVAAVLAKPVPDAQNFALSPAFLNCLSDGTTNLAITALLTRLKEVDTVTSGTQSATTGPGTVWTAQTLGKLDEYLSWVAPTMTTRNKATRKEFASALQANLKPYDEMMRSIAAAARLAYFQPQTNCNSLAVLDSSAREYAALERLHMLFQIRASALLAADRNGEAAGDVLTGLQLARLSEQAPDAQSCMRTHVLLTRSLQPIWEGIIGRQWTEAQLASFQTELSRFNLLANYTNAIHRVVLAHIELWRGIAEGKADLPPPHSNQSQGDGSAWKLQPRAWWLDHCVQLYQAGEKAIGRVDVAGAHVQTSGNWEELDGLPIDTSTSFLFSQAYWPGAYPGDIVFAQTAVNQGIIACALERFRLANGKYPETLDALVPTSLPGIPRDVVVGRPMIYENAGDEHFVLRGVGPNQIDDRKKPASDDWVWSFPTNAAPSASKAKK